MYEEETSNLFIQSQDYFPDFKEDIDHCKNMVENRILVDYEKGRTA
jgi:hypothetical protein